MSDQRFSRSEIDQMLALDSDQLYTKLVPHDAGSELHHPGALVAQGKAAFVALLRNTRRPVCKAYLSHGEAITDAAELVAIVAGAMIGATNLVHETVLPGAVLVVKIGLKEICKSLEGTHG